MYVAGYTFHVLNNLFMNHWGLQVLISNCLELIKFYVMMHDIDHRVNKKVDFRGD